MCFIRILDIGDIVLYLHVHDCAFQLVAHNIPCGALHLRYEHFPKIFASPLKLAAVHSTLSCALM